MTTESTVLILGASRGLGPAMARNSSSEDRAAIAALPKDQRYVTPPFARDWNALTL